MLYFRSVNIHIKYYSLVLKASQNASIKFYYPLDFVFFTG
ncbi:hypothetical protein AB28_5491 [Raoultella ornithinolytica 2-156-04_S1_C2]|nr:hypothetical protein AB00_5500 [Raoultella ornithinolytica 2-156-04_S1_C1]KDX09006.1 hypothetical protein AB28_5491 [Raoultella ornithinolytica 2-156-04_S1_C2]